MDFIPSRGVDSILILFYLCQRLTKMKLTHVSPKIDMRTLLSDILFDVVNITIKRQIRECRFL